MRTFELKAAAALVAGLMLAAAPAGQAQDAPAKPSVAAKTPASEVLDNGGIMLLPGRKLVVAWTKGKPPVAVSEGPAPPNPFGPMPSDPNKETWTLGKMPSSGLAAGQLAFTMWSEPERGTTVLLENAAGEGVGYLAQLVLPRAGKFTTSPTTTCAVANRGAGVETWAHPVAALAIAGLMSLERGYCIDPKTMRVYEAGQQPPSAKP